MLWEAPSPVCTRGPPQRPRPGRRPSLGGVGGRHPRHLHRAPSGAGADAVAHGPGTAAHALVCTRPTRVLVHVLCTRSQAHLLTCASARHVCAHTLRWRAFPRGAAAGAPSASVAPGEVCLLGTWEAQGDGPQTSRLPCLGPTVCCWGVNSGLLKAQVRTRDVAQKAGVPGRLVFLPSYV